LERPLNKKRKREGRLREDKVILLGGRRDLEYIV